MCILCSAFYLYSVLHSSSEDAIGSVYVYLQRTQSEVVFLLLYYIHIQQQVQQRMLVTGPMTI